MRRHSKLLVGRRRRPVGSVLYCRFGAANRPLGAALLERTLLRDRAPFSSKVYRTESTAQKGSICGTFWQFIPIRLWSSKVYP
jgi:hypothetical protein